MKTSMSMSFNATEIRNLRYRLGWSQAEMARTLGCEGQTIMEWEAGKQTPTDEYRGLLMRFFQNVESNSDKLQRRPVAEVLMAEQGLEQIHDFDVLTTLEGALLREKHNERN